MTPIREMALEIGCVCTTTLTALTTAIIAKTKKRMTSISGNPGDQKTGHQQIQHGYWKHEFPSEAHQLVIAEPRQGAANPDECEQNGACLRAEPEQREQPTLHDRQKEDARQNQKHNSERRKRVFVHFSSWVGRVV